MALHGGQQQPGQVGKTGQLSVAEAAVVGMVVEIAGKQRVIVFALHPRQPDWPATAQA